LPQDRFEQVVVETHVLVEGIEFLGLPGRQQAHVARQVGAHQGVVLLLHEAVIVLLPGAAAADATPLQTLAQEGLEMIVEELGAVVAMHFADGQRATRDDIGQDFAHGAFTATVEGPSLTPGRAHIDHLQGVDAIRGRAAVVDQVQLPVPHFGEVGGDPAGISRASAEGVSRRPRRLGKRGSSWRIRCRVRRRVERLTWANC